MATLCCEVEHQNVEEEDRTRIHWFAVRSTASAASSEKSPHKHWSRSRRLKSVDGAKTSAHTGASRFGDVYKSKDAPRRTRVVSMLDSPSAVTQGFEQSRPRS